MPVRILFLIPFLILCSRSEGQPVRGNVCHDLKKLVNEHVPESFEGWEATETRITEVDDPNSYLKLDFPFMGADYIYFTEEDEVNKRLLCYPLVTDNKDSALKYYIGLKEAFDQCDLIYKSFREPSNTVLGILATHTIGIDRRFYNSKMSLHQYVADTVERYWIEYELIAPKQR